MNNLRETQVRASKDRLTAQLPTYARKLRAWQPASNQRALASSEFKYVSTHKMCMPYPEDHTLHLAT
eukprot:6200429-Pleurochrysis_carterae.AAC.2